MPKNVLVADDSPTMRKLISMVLASDDFRLIEVDNGADAVVKAQEMNPDMVLADWSMPGKDGFEVCAALKENPKTARIPVLLLVSGQDVDEEKVRSSGADDYIAKPFESQALLDKACTLLKVPLVPPLPIRSHRQLFSSPPPPPASGVPVVSPPPAVSPTPVVSAPVVPPTPAVPVPPIAPLSSPLTSPLSSPLTSPLASPLSAGIEQAPTFLKPPSFPRAPSPTSFAPPSSFPAPSSLGEVVTPRPSPLAPRGTPLRTDAPVLGATPAPSPLANIAPAIPGLHATPLPTPKGTPAPRPAPAFPPRTPPPAYGVRPTSAYGMSTPTPVAPKPVAPTPVPLTQPIPRPAVAPPAPFAPRVALPKPTVSSTPAPIPSFFSPVARPASPYPPSSPPAPSRPASFARPPMSQQTPAGVGMRRADNPYGLEAPVVQAAPLASSTLNPEAALRELLPAVSKELLEKILWEVVPQLAEAMIREHIERLIQAKEKP